MATDRLQNPDSTRTLIPKRLATDAGPEIWLATAGASIGLSSA
jgi:hypothetical protein